MSHTDFEIAAHWPRLPEDHERDVAELKLSTGGRALTRLLDVQENRMRDFVRASAVSLALWFVDHWWRMRWEPIPDYRGATVEWRLRHELTSAPGGTIWPPLMIYGVGERVVIAPITGAKNVPGPVEFLPMLVTLVPGLSFEAGFNTFLAEVLENCAQAKDGRVLTSIAEQLNAERNDPDIASWRELEARLGYDPDEAPDGLIEQMSALEERLGGEAIEEAAVGNPGARSSIILEQAIAAAHESPVLVDLSAATRVTDQIDLTDTTRPIWALAEDAAARLRAASGRPTGPFLNRALGEILQTRWQSIKGATPTASGLPYGARSIDQGSRARIALQTRSAHDRRFELARALGDAIWTGHARFGIISRSKTDRQRFQRAFAQSLLCPFDDLRHHIDLTGPTEEQIDAAARRYHVHRSVVRTLLVNKGFLPQETLAEALEAA